MEEQLEETPIHEALYRPPLFLGVTREVLFLWGLLLGETLLFTVASGSVLLTVGAILFYVGIGLPVAQHLVKDDPEIIAVYDRYRKHRRILVPDPEVDAPVLPAYTAVPRRKG